MTDNLDVDVPYSLRISDRARRCRILVEATRVTLVVPRRMNVARAESFLRENREWIRGRLERNRRNLPALPAGTRLFRGLPVSDMSEAMMRRPTRVIIELEVRTQSARMSLKPRRIFLRDQRTRWGSCSRRGNISLNWRLVMAPPGVLSYVVIHELAHLREHNHGPRFWAIVESFCPEFHQHRKWLRGHGHLLHTGRMGGWDDGGMERKADPHVPNL